MQTSINLFSYLKNFQFQSPQASFAFTEGAAVAVDSAKTRIARGVADDIKYVKFINEFWTARQRQAASIHEISFRACFKPQLPRFFINLLTEPGDVVYDPFSGRGTTVLEAGLNGREVIANDVNPLSRFMSYPRFFIPEPHLLAKRLAEIFVDKSLRADRNLSMFFHPETEAEIVSLANYLQIRQETGREDHLDAWIRMVATNRLTGHSPGFFSVYTLPPNQAVLPERQLRINLKRNQKPEYRDTKRLILKKSQRLISGLTRQQMRNLRQVGEKALFISNDARHTPEIADESVQLTVTSPPFLNVVQYASDNWLRCWFNAINPEMVAKKITSCSTLPAWSEVMGDVIKELYRITRPGGWVAFEVGEVRNGTIRLDEAVVPLGAAAGFECNGILINQQQFTKTANIWGVQNNKKGTNSNRIVMFQKPD